MDNSYKFIQENSIDSIDAIIKSGQVVSYDETFQVPKIPDVSQVSNTPKSTIKKLTGREGQSIYDLCQMSYGSFDFLYKLIQDSNIDSLNESEFFKKDVSYDENLVVDKIFYTRIIKAGTVINTSLGGLLRVLGNEDGTYYGTEDGFLILIE